MQLASRSVAFPQISIDFTQGLPTEAEQKIAAGMALADDNADFRWKRWVDGCIQDVARRMQEFTVDDVIKALEALPTPPVTKNLAALGPRMKEVSKVLKYMEPTERVQRSRIGDKHGNLHRVWKSLIFQAGS
jgi:hypothetical protein